MLICAMKKWSDMEQPDRLPLEYNRKGMETNKKRITSAVKAKLCSEFERACNSYRHALEKMWDLNPAEGHWIGNEVGGLYDNGGFVTINLLDMIYCVEQDITLEECEEWMEYNIKAHEYNFNYINLKSWHMGCPRVPQETFDRLQGMKKDLEETIKAEKEKF